MKARGESAGLRIGGGKGSRRFLRIVAWAPALVTGALYLVPAGAAKPPDPAAILSRAEDIRSPDIEYAVDFQIKVAPKRGKIQERFGSYSMIARGKDRTMVLMRSPKQFFGGSLLMSDAGYWLLLPKAQKPFQLAEAQIITGDVSYGDIARMNLIASYTPTLSGEEDIDGQACYKLELAQTAATAHYPKIVYWVAKKRFLPWQLQYYGRTGDLLKTVRYKDYQKGRLGLRATGFQIEGPNDTTSLTFTGLRPIGTQRISFTPEGLRDFRDVAVSRLATDGPEVKLENLLALLPAKGP